MALADMLNSSAMLQAPATSKSVLGGSGVTSWTAKASGVACRVRQLEADTIDAYGRLGYKVTHRFYFDTDYGFEAAKDRIVFDGAAYHVRSVNNAGGQLNRLFQVDAERLPL